MRDCNEVFKAYSSFEESVVLISLGDLECEASSRDLALITAVFNTEAQALMMPNKSQNSWENVFFPPHLTQFVPSRCSECLSCFFFFLNKRKEKKRNS